MQRRALLWPAGMITAILLLFGPALGPGRTLAFRDTDRLYAPVRTLVDEALPAGSYSRLWAPPSLPKGMYLYRLESGSFDVTRRFVVTD